MRGIRIANGGKIRAFIYNGDGEGEFFDYDGEKVFSPVKDEEENIVRDGEGNIIVQEITTPLAEDDSVEYVALISGNEEWQYDYSETGGRIDFLEERQYKLDETSNTLQMFLTDSGDYSGALNIGNNIGDLEIGIVIKQEDIEYKCSVIPPTEESHCRTFVDGTEGDNTLPPLEYSWSQIKHIDVTLQIDPDSRQALVLSRECNDSNGECSGLELTREFVPRNIFNF
jgi:type IV pilus assembly protein PilW